MINYNICGSLICIVVLILIFGLFISSTLPKKMFAGNVDSDTSKIVRLDETQQHHYPAYVSLIYININDIQGCINYLESKGKKTIGDLLCLRFLYFFRMWLINRFYPELLSADIIRSMEEVRGISGSKKSQLDDAIEKFNKIHRDMGTKNATNNGLFNIDELDLSDYSINILKPGEVSGTTYKPSKWGDRGINSGPVTYIGKDSLLNDLDHCPELYAHTELQPLRNFVLKTPQAGTVQCFYIYIGNCGALGLTEDMFHGLTRDGLRKSSTNIIKEVSMGSNLGDIATSPPIDLDIPWPRLGQVTTGGCASLSSDDMAETIVGVGNNSRYRIAFEYVRRSVLSYINGGGDFTVRSILDSGTWDSLVDVLNSVPLACRARSSPENVGCAACTG